MFVQSLASKQQKQHNINSSLGFAPSSQNAIGASVNYGTNNTVKSSRVQQLTQNFENPELALMQRMSAPMQSFPSLPSFPMSSAADVRGFSSRSFPSAQSKHPTGQSQILNLAPNGQSQILNLVPNGQSQILNLGLPPKYKELCEPYTTALAKLAQNATSEKQILNLINTQSTTVPNVVPDVVSVAVAPVLANPEGLKQSIAERLTTVSVEAPLFVNPAESTSTTTIVSLPTLPQVESPKFLSNTTESVAEQPKTSLIDIKQAHETALQVDAIPLTTPVENQQSSPIVPANDAVVIDFKVEHVVENIAIVNDANSKVANSTAPANGGIEQSQNGNSESIQSTAIKTDPVSNLTSEPIIDNNNPSSPIVEVIKTIPLKRFTASRSLLELKEECKKRKLPVTGNKNVLEKRIQDHDDVKSKQVSPHV